MEVKNMSVRESGNTHDQLHNVKQVADRPPCIGNPKGRCIIAFIPNLGYEFGTIIRNHAYFDNDIHVHVKYFN